MKKVIMGNHALSYGAMLSRAQVISAYPITPQTQVVELLSEMCADGTLDAQFIKVESEHSAMASCIGALMHEMLHWAAGGRHPIVMGNINRSMAPGWSIWTDQNDSLSQRDTGWMQFYCSSNQEVVDTVIQGFKVAERLMIPAMVVLDAFALSHTYEVVEVPDQTLVDRFLPPFKPEIKLTPADPRAFGGLTGSEHYMELRYKLQKDMEKAPALIEETGREFEKLFGRSLPLVEPYRCDDADLVFITSGTAGYTARVAVDELRAAGVKAGNLRIKVFRPFPVDRVREVLAKAKKAAVVDRNCSYGAGGIFYQEVKSAVYGRPGMPPIFGYIAGLGGRDIMTGSFKEIAAHALARERAEEEIVWIGVKK
jgi:pyruvate/2-oxoacid:ferredoxin oxidoreductase alpha subunit